MIKQREISTFVEWGMIVDLLQDEDRHSDFIDLLPHGSGIDCDWSISQNKNYWLVSNSYHVMSCTGYYIGYADFTIKITKSYPATGSYWSVEFNGKYSQYLNQQHDLRSYLEDTLAYCFSDTIQWMTTE